MGLPPKQKLTVKEKLAEHNASQQNITQFCTEFILVFWRKLAGP